MPNLTIPDRWVAYRPVGNPIKKVRILAFKTPLAEKYNSKLEEIHYQGVKEYENSRFTPNDLIRIISSKGFHLGKVIDLTNTKRYYDGWEFSSKGIEYKKMNCEGHEIPSEDFVTRFKNEVAVFMETTDYNSLLGVHSTHGINRTGYLVCRYLIDCCGNKPEEAINAFNKSRGYNIERENYLEDLRKRIPNRYRITPPSRDTSYIRNYRQYPDQLRWNHSTQDLNYSQYSKGTFRSENPYERQNFHHSFGEFSQQSVSYNNSPNAYWSYDYEGNQGWYRRPRKATTFRKHHFEKPYQSRQNQPQNFGTRPVQQHQFKHNLPVNWLNRPRNISQTFSKKHKEPMNSHSRWKW